ncbi:MULTISPECIES: hypothetical protein [Mycobacterium]|nr:MULTISPECIES: hypothetical protein [Mycobacterium]ETZ29832.1 hypothetical protein L842_2960 [Mycobacterium intracellulare MIN_052511_1280]MCA2322349.1 hypothetical protein [Mycobacterium intracellulare]MCA2341623.1 hypothetical protein [Mycobacterium intracellulare]MCF1812722.1 hypothetical protein [Mycobacterium intracellulare subsp. intracellulare]MDM3907576.1 hypothetical protein [Mycobacterium intracellulare subsp. chimaera]
MTESTNSPAGPDLASASFLNPILTSAAMELSSVSVGATAVRLTSSDESPTAR